MENMEIIKGNIKSMQSVFLLAIMHVWNKVLKSKYGQRTPLIGLNTRPMF
jgi:hypothetical protein